MGSIYPEQGRSAWILERRPERLPADPFKPSAFFLEQELSDSGRLVSSGVILLVNKECPWRCLMCDLWKHTLDRSVPPGAIPRQIDVALAGFNGMPWQVKLYNSGSFFDAAAIPVGDYAAISEKLSTSRRVVVESHPRLVGERVLKFRDLLKPSLEVALGLETVHPGVLPRLNKNFTLDDFAAAVDFLRGHGMSARAFVLVRPPFLDETEGFEWAVRSAEFALKTGADVVSLIPTRPGNGALEHLQAAGEFAPPRLVTLERVQETLLERGCRRVFSDTWDLEQFSACPVCFPLRLERLARMNQTQKIPPAANCKSCGEE
jgi:radical SAM enzyme (TIGR01210 family)